MLFDSNSGTMPFQDALKNFNEHLVRAAITKSCVGDVADAVCCLPLGATLDDILEKFKWLIWVHRILLIL